MNSRTLFFRGTLLGLGLGIALSWSLYFAFKTERVSTKTVLSETPRSSPPANTNTKTVLSDTPKSSSSVSNNSGSNSADQVGLPIADLIASFRRMAADGPGMYAELTEKSFENYRLKHVDEYKALFASFGLDENMIAEAMFQWEEVMRAKGSSQGAINRTSGLEMARDRSLKRMLGDKYQDYLDFELSKPAEKQIAEFRMFLDESGLVASDLDLTTLVALSREHRMGIATFAPYGPPQPGKGGNAVLLAGTLDYLTLTDENSRRVIADAESKGISPAVINALRSYYLKRRGSIQEMIDIANNPAAIAAKYDQQMGEVKALTQARAASLEKQAEATSRGRGSSGAR